MSQVGGSLGCSKHANLLVFFGFEVVAVQGRGGRGGLEKFKEALSSLTFLLHPKVGIDFPPVTAINENFCVAAQARAPCVSYLFKYDYLHFTASQQNHNELCQPRQPRVAFLCVSK